jgi:hypothetical protein
LHWWMDRMDRTAAARGARARAAHPQPSRSSARRAGGGTAIYRGFRRPPAAALRRLVKPTGCIGVQHALDMPAAAEQHLLLALLLLPLVVTARDNGVALLPPMGYNQWSVSRSHSGGYPPTLCVCCMRRIFGSCPSLFLPAPLYSLQACCRFATQYVYLTRCYNVRYIMTLVGTSSITTSTAAFSWRPLSS